MKKFLSTQQKVKKVAGGRIFGRIITFSRLYTYTLPSKSTWIATVPT